MPQDDKACSVVLLLLMDLCRPCRNTIETVQKPKNIEYHAYMYVGFNTAVGAVAYAVATTSTAPYNTLNRYQKAYMYS